MSALSYSEYRDYKLYAWIFPHACSMFCLLPEHYFQQNLCLTFHANSSIEMKCQTFRIFDKHQTFGCDVCLFSFHSDDMRAMKVENALMCWMLFCICLFFKHFSPPEQRLLCFITFSIRFALQALNHVPNAYILDFVSFRLNKFRHSSLSDFGQKVMGRENVQHSKGLSCF